MAEISANHGGSVETLGESVKRALSAGADKVKIQIYEPQSLTSPSIAVNPIPQGPWAGRDLFDLYSEGSISFSKVESFFHTLEQSERSQVFASVFCMEGLKLLEKFSRGHVKIASFEVGHRELVLEALTRFETIHVSLGVASAEDINWLVREAESLKKTKNLVLYSCVSDYPANINDYDFSEAISLAINYGCRYGVSDHTTGEAMPLLAKKIGASYWERHFDPGFGGLDEHFSIGCVQLKRIIELLRTENIVKDQNRGQNYFKRSLYFKKALDEGKTVTASDVVCLRPNNGFTFADFDALDNKRLKRGVQPFEALSNDCFE